MELEEQAKYFMGKYFLKEFLYVNVELLNEPVRIGDYIPEIIRKIDGKNINEILDEIFESGSVLNAEMPDLIGFLKRYIELCEENDGSEPLIHKILENIGNATRKLVKAFVYETGKRLAISNGISTNDTITEYEFGKMIYNELKNSEVEGYFIYELEFIEKEFNF